MTLPVVPTDSPNEKQHRTVIANSLNELVKFFNTIKSDSWTPLVQGAGTAGTYEIATNGCRYTRIGRRVNLDVLVVMAGALTGGGAGNLNITGLPFNKAVNTRPVGSVWTSGVDFTTSGASIALSFNTFAATSKTLIILEAVDNAAGSTIPITAIAANDSIFGSICYETDDP
jgi:hypothetical protein